MGSDFRYAWRSLWRRPGFTLVALLTLAGGIAANTAIFSVFRWILLRPLPYPAAERLVAIQEIVPAWSRFGPALPVSAWHFREWRKQSRSIEQAALVGDQLYTLTSEGEPARIAGARVSASLFPVLGVHAALGRTFTEAEDQAGRDGVAVISHRLWRTRFHGDPATVGRKILLNGVSVEIVGILPPDARIPSQGQLEALLASDVPADIWRPFAIQESDLAVMAEFNFGCVARLRGGVSPARGLAELNSIESGIVKDLAEPVALYAALTPLHEQMTGKSRGSLTLLMAASGALLLMVVVNLANLLLARASSRRRELAIRTAIGAGMGRLVRQLLTESVLLAAMGGALGVLVARWALDAIVHKAPLELAGMEDVHLDAAAMAFAAAISLASGVLFGVLPAWRMARTDPQVALRASGRSATESREGGRWRRSLIAAEVALCAMCLVIGGLLLGSFVRLSGVDKGFDTDRALTLSLSLPPVRYPGAADRARFMRTLLDRVRDVPGVVAAGVSNRAPLSGQGSNLGIFVEGVQMPESQRPIVDYRSVSPEYFRAMGIPLVAGRVIREQDGEHWVATVSEQTARRLWPGQNVLGRRFRLWGEDAPPIEIVGVVGDVRTSLQKTPNMTVYLPYWQVARGDFALVVRTSRDQAAVGARVRGEVRALDSQLVVPEIRTLGDVVDRAVAPRRFQLELILAFALVALALAAVGVYGVVSQAVAQRTGEIGIRMALGATRGEVGLMMGRQGLTPVIAGLAVGLAGSILAARLVNGLLFGVRALDPVAFGGTAFVLLAAASLACAIPTLRATRIDPLVALREE